MLQANTRRRGTATTTPWAGLMLSCVYTVAVPVSSDPSREETVHGERVGAAATVSITAALLGRAMAAGLVGLVLMSPLLLGVPVVLGVFEAEPILEFATIGSFFGLRPDVIGPVLGLDPRLLLGGILFAIGGILFLPVQFVVVGAFLPPESPRFARGATFALLWWTGFLFAFWPGGGLTTVVVFLLVSVLAHLIYGFSLGYLIDRWTEIPQHEV